MNPKSSFFFYIGALLLLFACKSEQSESTTTVENKSSSEVIYHIFIRSFYDSNGDKNGDLVGIRQKLDYLEELGITSIMLTPTVESVYYHNYFADDFEKIDPAYGTNDDWIKLVKDIHKRNMKIYLDQEFQYATLKQKWFKDSYKNPASPYSEYILYQDRLQEQPEPIVYDIDTLKGYNDSIRKVATVNLKSPKVKEYFENLLIYWMDPNGDGSFEDGVDGFRLDHMMDDLDYKGILTDLFSDFWCPLINNLKKVNPDIQFIAEQAEWRDYGMDYLNQGCVDKIFAFNVWGSILSFEKDVVEAIADTTFIQNQTNKEQLVFIENHDVDRFASFVKQDKRKLRVGAVLNFFLGGTPAIYYGQELGMFGKGGDFGDFDDSDGKDIPRRLAFPWYKNQTADGIANWYQTTESWWDSINPVPPANYSLEEQQKDPESLFSYYKELISFYKKNEVLVNGKYQPLTNSNEAVLSFLRVLPDDYMLVAINLSDQTQTFELPVKFADFQENPSKTPELKWGNAKISLTDKGFTAELAPFETVVWGNPF